MGLRSVFNFGEQSRNSRNIQGTFGKRSGNIQGTFREHSGNIQHHPVTTQHQHTTERIDGRARTLQEASYESRSMPKR